MPMKLSRDQIQQYERDGYTVARAVLGAGIIRAHPGAREGNRAWRPSAEEAKSSIMRNMQAFREGLAADAGKNRSEHSVKIMNGDRFDATLRDAMRSPALLDAVSSLIGDDLLAFLFMVIYKPPGVPDSAHPFHQDGLYFAFEPHDRVVGALACARSTRRGERDAVRRARHAPTPNRASTRCCPV